jgi:outer membrane protein OmpA-like peptidoglycan-associated protein
MTRTPAILALALVMGVGGCQSMRNARDRIVRAPPACQDATVSIYFEKDVADLTPDSRRVVTEAAQRAKSCTVKSVSVVGLADASGDPAANLELSKKRAATVTAALAGAGLTGPELQVDAQGDAGAITPDGKAAPLRRRTDITFHLSAAK